jgi:hypothetical protein
MALAEHPHGRALHLYARGPIEMRRQFFLGPVGSVKLTPLGTIVHPRLDGRRQRLGNTAPLARCPWDLSTGQTTCMKLLEPQPHGGAMYLKILGNRLTLPPAMGHHDRLAPVTESSVMGRFEDLFQLRLCRCRQPDPPHLFPPLVKSCPRGYLKKDARSSAACIRGTQLSAADLHGANLTLADLSGAILSKATLYRADLRGAVFTGADLREADLSGTMFNPALFDRDIFIGASLRGASFSRVDLSQRDLSGQDLTEVDFREAKLIDTNLNRAILTDSWLWETQRTGWSIQDADSSVS